MPRTMLQLRIEALIHHLDQAQTTSVWKQTLDLKTFDVDSVLWGYAIEKIYTEAGELREQLKRLETELRVGAMDESEAWRRFARVQAASTEVFEEGLGLLGGLALRDRTQEEHICRVADAYILELSGDTGRRSSFAIPGLDVRLFSALRRVAKMQFPEWTIWTLPLVAHEYGHVVIEESRLGKVAASLADEMAVEEVERDHGDIVDALEVPHA